MSQYENQRVRFYERNWVASICKQPTALLRACAVGILLIAVHFYCLNVGYATSQDIHFAAPESFHAVHVNADRTASWQQGESVVYHFVGNIEIRQSSVLATADEAIVWVQPINEQPDTNRLIVYLEGEQVVVRKIHAGDAHQVTGHTEDAVVDKVWLGRFKTRERIAIFPEPEGLSADVPSIFQRALEYHRNQTESPIKQVSFINQERTFQTVIDPRTGLTRQIVDESVPTVPDLNDPSIQIPPIENQNIDPIVSPEITPNQPLAPGNANVRFLKRDPTQELNLQRLSDPNNPNAFVWIITGGVRVLIRSPDISQLDAFKSDQEKQVLILADNVVAWQSPMGDGTDRWEMYLDGNVIFSKDRRVIYSRQMYYDANNQSGTLLDADFYTPIQNFEGLVRLKADVIEQVDANNLTAYGAAFTSSRLAFPQYWLQSDSISIERQQSTATDPLTGIAVTNPATGLPQTNEEYFATSNRNRVYAAGIPVFAWPRFRSSLEDPSLYIKRLRIGNDNVFGTQLLTTWDLYQLLGLRNRPEGTELLGSLDYLSDRGIALGTEAKYQRTSFLGIAGQVRGEYRSWFINDDGLDNLGRGRTALTPEEELRGRLRWRHFHKLGPGYNLRAELGYISDRNFLESFYEREWDTEKDATTGFWLERNVGTQSFNLTANLQLNDFFTQTSWLPRFDHFILGQPLFGRIGGVRHGHTHAGYGRVRVADAPLDPAELFDPLAFEADVDGIRAGTRQQLEFPRQLGAVKVVPYVLGDVTYWQEDLNGDDALRAYGQAGIRASLPFWRVDPTIQSTLWNVNGLAHKFSFDVDAFYADSSQDLTRFALFDNLDDDSQEAFRRRFAFNTFGIIPGQDVPPEFDERFFALRNGFQSDVTASSSEIADDLSIVKFGFRQRWQTKRGLPGNERIIDWITFNLSTAFFPESDRDNFGSDFGVLDYNFKWFIGDRVSLVSDGYADFFSQGLRTVSVGLQSNRPGVSNAYIGIRSIEGPISSNVLSTALTYRMSEKWGLRANSQIDFGEAGTIGNGISAIYIGESFLWQFGINADLSRSNVGFRFGFEPRFLQRPRLFRPGGQAIPPASSQFLE